jgi:hypothetical protein
MCGSALFGKPPKPVPPAQFQDAKSPEYSATSTADKANRRRGYQATMLASVFKGQLGTPRTTAPGSTLGA